MTNYSSHQSNDHSFAEVFSTSIPVAAAYVPLGAAKAILMVNIGLDWYWPLITAILVYAGSLEFLIVGYLAMGMTLPMVAWTTFLVNFRHLFYGLSYSLERHKSRLGKIYGAFSLTDEAYVLTSLGKGKHYHGKNLLQLQMLMQFWWFLGSCFGVIIGQNLPESFTGFEFAMTAMFLVLALDSMSKEFHPQSLILTILAVIIGLLSEQLCLENFFLLAGLVSYFLMLSASFLLRKRAA